MKVKILLPPLIIVSCIALMIWLVYPAYTNGVDGVKEQREKMVKERDNLADAQQKAENVSRMAAQLESSKVDYDTIMTFIVDSLKEEEIIDNLNFIANSEGLSVINLSVKPASISRPELPVNEAGEPVVDETGAPVIENITVKAKDAEVAYSVIGSYDKIKNVLDKVYKLKRYNSVKSLNIVPESAQGEDGKKATPSDTLKADMVLNFNMLRKFNSTVSMNNPLFAQTSFDLKVAGDIRAKKSVDILKMNIDQAGRANPFLP